MDHQFGYRLLMLAAITALNAFFAGSEAALLSARQPALRRLADKGNAGAAAALSLLGNTERMLSVIQVGVTLASLGMGWAGEQAFYELLLGVFAPLATPATALVLHAAALLAAFLVLTLLLVVIGEVVPKNLAIQSADRMSVLVAPPLLVFYRLAGPFVTVVEGLVSAVSRLLRLRGRPLGLGHTAEELKYIVRSSQLDQFENKAIRRLLELERYVAREVMVPRNDIVSLPAGADLDSVLSTVIDTQFTRIPVYESQPEHIIGVLHVKDLLRIWNDRRRSNLLRKPVAPFQLRRLLRKPLVVPESKGLAELLEDFRASHNQLALVVDEFGTIAGLVTLEDVLEQVFGEIEDEFDARRPAPSPGARRIELDGKTSIRDLETQYGIELPAEAGFETLAGFLLFRLGYLPTAGESVEHAGRRFVIVQMDRNRIAKVRIERLEPPAASTK